MGAFVQRLQSARANIHRNIQPRFHGNDNVSVDEELSEDQLLQYLSHYSGNNHPGPQVRALMTILAGQDWSITAGFHRGGLGGAAGGADPRDHITLSTGHHLRFRDDRRTLIEITGHGIPLSEAREAAQSGPSQAEQDLDAWKEAFGLNDQQAAKAALRFKQSRGPGAPTKSAIAENILKHAK